MLELKDRQIAAVKRQYRNSLPAIKKIESLNMKIDELVKERDLQQAFLDGGEAGIRALTGGYASYELIKCEYIPQFNEDGTPKMDKEGKYQVKKQVLSFVPPVEPPVTETGNDFDADPCDSCECNMGLSEEEWNEAQKFVAEEQLSEELLRTGELKPEDFLMNTNNNTSTEADN